MTAHKEPDSNTHTFFFREPEAMALVRERARYRGRIAIWSAGCSTGDEVYSLAIRLDGFEREITGSDIRSDALATAESGTYPERRLRHTPADIVRTYFTRHGDNVRVEPQVRHNLRFVRHHILNDAPLKPLNAPLWDVIFCRNVLLYYYGDEVTTAISRLASVLAPDGILVLGASEWLSSDFLAKLPKEHQLVAELEGNVAVLKRGVPRVRSSVQAREPTAKPSVPLPPPTLDTDELRSKGDALMDAGDAKGAIELFETGIRRDPLSADLYARVGFCHLARGDRGSAETALRRALFLTPTLWPAALVLGDLLMTEDTRAARRFLLQAWDAVEKGTLDPASTTAMKLAPFICAESAALDAVRVRLAWLNARQS